MIPTDNNTGVAVMTLEEFRMECLERYHAEPVLLSTDEEDPLVHWYCGDDLHGFVKSGGEVSPGNAYFFADYGDEKGFAEFGK